MRVSFGKRWLLLASLFTILLPHHCLADEVETRYNAALQLLAQGDAEQLLQVSTTLHQQFPQRLEGQEADFLIARAWEMKGDLEQAMRAYLRFLKHNLNTVHRMEAQLKVSMLRVGLKAKQPEVLQQMLQAMNVRSAGDDLAAIRLLQRLVVYAPNHPLADDALNMLAYMQLVDTHHHQAAADAYRQLLKSYPDSSYVDSALYGLGVALEESGDWLGARRTYESLREKHMAGSLLGVTFAKDNYLSRVWFNKAESRLSRLDMRQRVNEVGQKIIQKFGFMLGMGDRLAVDQPVGSGQSFRPIERLIAEHGLKPQSITHWITRETDWQWETPDRLKALVRAGYTPVVVDWYFGDQISPEYVTQHRADYMKHIREQLIPLIQELPEVWVLLEPEFNKHGMEKWGAWGEISRDVIALIHQQVAGSRVGLVVGNWVDTQQSDIKAVMAEAVEVSDFVAFQEMVSSYDARTALDPGWSPVDRSVRLATFLQETFHKPIYMGYLAVSSFGGWEKKQAQMLKLFQNAMPELAYHGVIGASYFSLYDDPLHVGWFAEAEKELGLLRASGEPKAALNIWKAWEQQRMRDDLFSPHLLQGGMLYGLPLDARQGQGVVGSLQTQEWCHWKVTIRGERSQAERFFVGAGKDIHFHWEGMANRGTFTRERCSMILEAEDLSGNKMRRDFSESCTIVSPHPQQEAYDYPLRDEPEIYHWGDVEADYRSEAGEDFLQLKLQAAHAGVVLPLQEGESEDFSGLANGSMWHIRVRLQKYPAEGVMLGIEDTQGFRSSLLLSGYLQADLLQEWQELLIPLQDFSLWGVKDGAAGKRERQRLDWHHIRQWVVTTDQQPQALDLMDMRLLRGL